MLAWLDISIKDIIDILLLAVFLYYAFTTIALLREPLTLHGDHRLPSGSGS